MSGTISRNELLALEGDNVMHRMFNVRNNAAAGPHESGERQAIYAGSDTAEAYSQGFLHGRALRALALSAAEELPKPPLPVREKPALPVRERRARRMDETYERQFYSFQDNKRAVKAIDSPLWPNAAISSTTSASQLPLPPFTQQLSSSLNDDSTSDGNITGDEEDGWQTMNPKKLRALAKKSLGPPHKYEATQIVVGQPERPQPNTTAPRQMLIEQEIPAFSVRETYPGVEPLWSSSNHVGETERFGTEQFFNYEASKAASHEDWARRQALFGQLLLANVGPETQTTVEGVLMTPSEAAEEFERFEME